MSANLPHIDPIWLFVLLTLLTLTLFLSLSSRWTRLTFRIWAWLEARRVFAAGASKEIIGRTEWKLAWACFEFGRILSLADARRAWAYIGLAGDHLARHAAPVRRMFLVAVLIGVDGAALGYSFAPVAGTNVSQQMLDYLAVAVGLIGSALFAGLMHAAAVHLHERHNTRGVRHRIIAEGHKTPARRVTLEDSQDIDESETPSVRQFARINPVTTLSPVILSIGLVIFVATALWVVRFQELTQMRAAGVDGLPTDVAELTGITLLSVLFTALQLGVFWLAYTNAWCGRDSGAAWRRLMNGKLRTEFDVKAHNLRALGFAESIHTLFHQNLSRINQAVGYQPVQPVIYPAQVLARMLAEPNRTRNQKMLTEQ